MGASSGIRGSRCGLSLYPSYALLSSKTGTRDPNEFSEVAEFDSSHSSHLDAALPEAKWEISDDQR